jgi:hypothetical protein
VVEQTVEDVRNVEGGTKQAWDACDTTAQVGVQWTPHTGTAKGKVTREGGWRSSASETSGGTGNETLWRRPEA